MSVYIKNTGPMFNEKDTRGESRAMGDQGTVRVIVQNQEYSFGPNEGKVIADDGIAALIVAADPQSRLRVMDDREIGIRSNASTAFSSF